MVGCVIIGILPEPQKHRDWTKIEAFLEPASKLGGVPILDEHEALWIVHDGHLIAAATARLTEDGIGEIVLCGGVGASDWAQALADTICDWFRDEGMDYARIYGRKGWARVLKGWRHIGGANGFTWLERALHE